MTDEKNPFKHNNPPAENQRAELEQKNEDLIKRKDELLDAVSRMPREIANDEVQDKFIDQVKLMKSCAKDAGSRQVIDKAPYLEGGRTVDGFYKPIQNTLSDAAKRIENGPLRTYQRKKYDAEQARIRAEKIEAERIADEERKAAEAAAKLATSDEDLETAIAAEDRANDAQQDAEKAAEAAAAPTNDLTRTHATYGGKASSSKKATFKIDNIREIDLEALRPFIQIGAIEMAIRNYMKVHKGPAADVPPVKGITFFDDFKTTVR